MQSRAVFSARSAQPGGGNTLLLGRTRDKRGIRWWQDTYTDASLRHHRVGLGVCWRAKAATEQRSRHGRQERVSARALDTIVDVNHAEMLALLLAVQLTPEDVALHLHTDSACCLSMLRKSPKRVKPKYSQLLDELQHAVHDRDACTLFSKVRAHAGVPGNELADRLAKQGTNIHRTCSTTTTTWRPSSGGVLLMSVDQPEVGGDTF